MMRISIFYVLLSVTVMACDAVEVEQTAAVDQAFINNQGTALQGLNLQGASLAGMTMQGMLVTGATLSGVALNHVRVERGELVAERGSTTVRGTALVGAHVRAQVHDPAQPSRTAVVQYRITAIAPELSGYDPTHTGNTFLYTLEQLVAETGAWQPACSADSDGRRVAIPVAAIWDDRGTRLVSSSLFTFGCTTGVIAKCYRWGYRPWVTGFGDLVEMHWTCTRMARADYCGIGRSHTRDGTQINFWDKLPSPGPIQRHGGLLGLPPLGMGFEAGWNTGGAVCLSRTRWLLNDGLIIAQLCPDRLVSPGLLGQTVCDTLSDVLDLDSDAKLFNEASLLNVIGPGN